MTNNTQRSLGVFSLSMIIASLIGSVTFWSFLGGYGYTSAVFYPLAIIVFFIPCLLASSELTSSFRRPGGVYYWIKEAFGRLAGFLGIWLLWLQSVCWLPVPLIWISDSMARAFFPFWIDNSAYHLVVALGILWTLTFLLLKGIYILKILSIGCFFLGYLLPGVLIIIMGLLAFVHSPFAFHLHPVEEFHFQMLNPKNWAIFIAITYSIVGVEISSLHSQNVKNPKSTYPKALFLAGILISILTVLGAFAISPFTPKGTSNLYLGTSHTLSRFLNHFHLPGLYPVVTLLLAIGLLGMVANWLAGPVRGMYYAGKEGNLPPIFHNANDRLMPTPLFIAQAILTSILSAAYILIPNFRHTYWVLFSLTTILYLLLYVLIFSAVIKLRYKKPNEERPFIIPGKKIGLWTIAGLGALTSIISFFLGFIVPPTDFNVATLTYCLLLSFGTFILCLVPWFIRLFKKTSWIFHGSIESNEAPE